MEAKYARGLKSTRAFYGRNDGAMLGVVFQAMLNIKQITCHKKIIIKKLLIMISTAGHSALAGRVFFPRTHQNFTAVTKPAAAVLPGQDERERLAVKAPQTHGNGTVRSCF